MDSNNWATEILPGFLFVGGEDHANDVKNLRKHNITHLLNLAREVESELDPQEFVIQKVEYPGIFEQEPRLTNFLLNQVAWIEKVRSEVPNAKILIHCKVTKENEKKGMKEAQKNENKSKINFS